jgi:hypothetical protein
MYGLVWFWSSSQTIGSLRWHRSSQSSSQMMVPSTWWWPSRSNLVIWCVTFAALLCSTRSSWNGVVLFTTILSLAQLYYLPISSEGRSMMVSTKKQGALLLQQG